MATIINNHSATLTLTVYLNSGQTYTTVIYPGGGWSIPSDVSAVGVDEENQA